jgi:hypothetical protein
MYDEIWENEIVLVPKVRSLEILQIHSTILHTGDQSRLLFC